MNTKEELTNKICHLKKEIQELIDYKKNNSKTSSKDKLETVDEQKKNYIQKISDYTIQLKDLVKKEKQKTTLLNNIKKAQNANDSINYHFAKKYGNTEDLENLKKGKEIRENVRQEYLHYLNLEQNFYQLDSKELPGILFLHQNVINEYGLCPSILGNFDLNFIDKFDINQESILIENNRKEWLENTPDKGKIYYDLLDNIYNEKDVYELSDLLKKSETLIENTIKNYITESQFEIYKESINLVKEYNNCTIKTKKIKEKYKLIIHNLSILHNETSLAINKYLEIKYSINLPINNIANSNKNNESASKNLYIVTDFEENISEYKIQSDNIVQKKKYIINIRKNLKQDFHDFLMKKPDTKFTQLNEEKIIKEPIQEGKYFKNWSNLTMDEKKERLDSFCSLHVNKKFKNLGQGQEQEQEDSKQQLSNLLKEYLENKKLTCKDLVWKSDKGIIDKIKILKYNEETKLFYLEKAEKVKVDKDNLKNTKLQKSVSKKSILHKANEKTVNEEMLKFILKYNGTNTHDNIDITNYIDEFVERIKNKLKLKKISKDDKIQLTSKLVDMNNIITNNPTI